MGRFFTPQGQTISATNKPTTQNPVTQFSKLGGKIPNPLSLPILPVKFRAAATKGLDGGTRSD